MSRSSTITFCPEIEQPVRIDQSEGECRTQHGCEQACCPLVHDFEPDKFNFLVALSGSSFRSGR